MVATIGPPLAFLKKQKEAVSGNFGKSSQVTCGFVPEILDAIDVILPVHEPLGMIYPHMVGIRDIECIAVLYPG